jgi:hypothetical protein
MSALSEHPMGRGELPRREEAGLPSAAWPGLCCPGRGGQVIPLLVDQAQTVFAASAGMLLVWAVVSVATGGRVDFIMYRLCAPIFTVSAVLILIGAFA